MEVYGSLWKFMEVYGSLWKFMEVYGSLWKFMEVYGTLVLSCFCLVSVLTRLGQD